MARVSQPLGLVMDATQLVSPAGGGVPAGQEDEEETDRR